MKSICITGAVQSDLQTVANILQQAGMKQPKPARRANDSVDIGFWHEQVMALAAGDSGGVQPISNPGRLWEQLASDIFVANIQSKVWGWSDTHSTWLLDYWLDFEPHLNFILVCVSPQHMLANAIASETDAISVERMMGAWQAHHQELLRFHHRNPQCSLLIDFSECANYPGELIERCAEQWKLPLTMPDDVAYAESTHDSLSLYLAQQLCQGYPQVASLQHELAATITRLGEADQVTHTMALAPAQIIAGYRALRDRSAELQQVQAADEALIALKNQFDDAMASHAQQRKEGEALFNEAAQEIDLLQLQLCRTQEELETTILEYESQQARMETFAQANATLKADRELLAQEKSALAAQHETLQQEVTALTQARDEQGQLAAQRQTQIEALTQERDSHASHAAERQIQIDALAQEINVLTQTRDEQARILADSRAQLERLNKAQAENSELLLLELHQAHLESERYFQQHQEALIRLQAAEARWQRQLQRNPACIDYETIEILPTTSPGEDGVITWRLTNVSAAGHYHPILEFKTPLEQGVAGLIFTRSTAEGGSLLTRWPAATNQQHELILMPAGSKANIQQCIENLLDLATSDWSLLQTLTALLIETLTSPAILATHADIQPLALRAGLEKFRQILQKFPPALRYDQVQLKREQVNPGYEHLQLHFDNLSFDGKCWPEFEFRLACANVLPDRFGTNPRLEFPEESGQAPFEAWFVESFDDFGTKLELRFAQPDAMDMAIWWRLTEHDRTFLAALIKRLPAILGALQSAEGQLKRPWSYWDKMAREIQRIVALRTVVPPASTPVAPIQPAAPETSAPPSKEPKQPLELPPTVKTTEKSLPKKPASKTKAAKPARSSRNRKARK